MNKFSGIFLLAFAVVSVKAQDKPVPAEIKPFILKGYTVLDYKAGDINGDKRTDAILILKVAGEDSVTDYEASIKMKRPVFLLIRQANGKLKIEKRNDDLILCKECGGIFGDPYAGLDIKNGNFMISFYGGSSWRWGDDYTFSYSASAGDWMLVKEKQVSYQDGDPDKTMKTILLNSDELENVRFGKFKGTEDNDEGKWKTVAARSYFYDVPKIGSKTRKGYLLKGNIVDCTRVLKNFIEVSFQNDKQQITTGYVLRKDMEKIK